MDVKTAGASQESGIPKETGTAGRRITDINTEVISIYQRQSQLYQQDEALRRRYFERHPTFFACLKCMDGRVKFPAMTQTARGLDAAVVMATKIIEDKITSAPPDEQVTIFTNIFYGNSRGILSSLPAMDKRCAVRRSRGLQEFAQTHIRKHCAPLWKSGRLHFLTAVTRESTRELEIIEQGPVR